MKDFGWIVTGFVGTKAFCLGEKKAFLGDWNVAGNFYM